MYGCCSSCSAEFELFPPSRNKETSSAVGDFKQFPIVWDTWPTKAERRRRTKAGASLSDAARINSVLFAFHRKFREDFGLYYFVCWPLENSEQFRHSHGCFLKENCWITTSFFGWWNPFLWVLKIHEFFVASGERAFFSAK